MDEKKRQKQLIWGIALVVMGIATFFRIPQVMPGIIKEFEYFSSISGLVYFSVYLLPVLLVAGGLKKLFNHYKKRGEQDSQ